MSMAKADLDGSAFLEALDEKHILPSFSPVVAALIEVAAKDETSVGQIADLITKDPSLTARMLKLANSPFYRTRCPAATVLQAVARIGVRQTRLFALSVSLKDAFPLKRGGPIDYGRFWRLCLYQGLLARWLARRLKVGDPEEAFTAGLTLEIGLLALVRACANGTRLDLDCPLTSLLAQEKEAYCIHHRQIGEALLRSWGFPEHIVACQQSFAFRENLTGLSDLARICAMAGELSTAICEPHADLRELFDTVEASFGLSRGVVIEAVGAVLEHVYAIAEAFDVPVDSTKDTIELIEKANQALTRLVSRDLEHVPTESLVLSGTLPEPKETPDAARVTLEAAAHKIRNPVDALGRFARRLAKTIDPTSREGTYVRVIMSETERLEQALYGMESEVTGTKARVREPGN
jgi:two-component system cell cycle response regulator